MTETRNFTLERDNEIIPVVRKIFKALAEREDLMVGSSETVTVEKLTEYYANIYKEVIIPLFIEHNIKLNSIPSVFQFLGQPTDMLNNITTTSFENNRDMADAFKYGLEDIDDLRVVDIDSALKEGFAKKVVKEDEAK